MGAMEAFDEAIRDWLLADPALTAIVGDRVFTDMAPIGALTPYVIVSWQSWQEIVEYTRVPQIDATANIRIVVDLEQEGQDARLATRGADAIADRMRGAALEVADGWGVHWCRPRGRHRTPHLIDRYNFSSAGVLTQIGAIQA